MCGHGRTGCSLAARRSSRGPSQASRRGRSKRPFANRGGSGFWGSARYSEPLDGAGGTRRTPGAKSTTSRTASGFATGATSSSDDSAPHSERLPGPVELALCAVDQRSGARVAVAKVRSAGFGVDGGTLFASLGSDSAKAGATSVRTKSGRRTEMARGRISIDSRTGATV